MKYLNPLLWYNTIHPDFDPVTESYTETKTRQQRARDKIGGHVFSEDTICHGLLISRHMVDIATTAVTRDGNGNRYRIITSYNPKGFIRVRDYVKCWESDHITFADPGTWSHVHKFKLPEYLFDQEDLIDYYSQLGFDLAGSVDWPIIERIMQKDETGKRTFIQLSDKIKEYRRNLTIEMAGLFIKACKKRKDLPFMPFGTIQGYSMETYKDSLRRLLKLDYDYIAVGGLPASSEKEVLEMLPMINKEVKRAGKLGIGIHLYGRFPSPKATAAFLKYGVTSFDNNSSFIAASGLSTCNYFCPEFAKGFYDTPMVHDFYSLKIPSARGHSVRRLKNSGSEDYNRVLELSDGLFRDFCLYSDNEEKKYLRRFLNNYVEFNEILNSTRRNPFNPAKMNRVARDAAKALAAKAWTRCNCEACKSIKAHVILIRGQQRCNFAFLHNTAIQYQRLLLETKKARKHITREEFDWEIVRKIADNNINNWR